MIKHIVMWKLKDEAEGNSKAENAAILKERLEALPSKITELDTAELGINFIEANNDAVCDIVLTTTCNTKEDLKVYAAHPEHQKVVEYILKVTSERRVVDYVS